MILHARLVVKMCGANSRGALRPERSALGLGPVAIVSKLDWGSFAGDLMKRGMGARWEPGGASSVDCALWQSSAAARWPDVSLIRGLWHSSAAARWPDV